MELIALYSRDAATNLSLRFSGYSAGAPVAPIAALDAAWSLANGSLPGDRIRLGPTHAFGLTHRVFAIIVARAQVHVRTRRVRSTQGQRLVVVPQNRRSAHQSDDEQGATRLSVRRSRQKRHARTHLARRAITSAV